MSEVVLIPCRFCSGLVEVKLSELNDGQQMLVGGRLVPAPPITKELLAEVGTYHETCRQRKSQRRGFSVLVEVTELVEDVATEVVGAFEVTVEASQDGQRFVDLVDQLSTKVQEAWAQLLKGANVVDMPDQNDRVTLVEGESAAVPEPTQAKIMGHPVMREDHGFPRGGAEQPVGGRSLWTP